MFKVVMAPDSKIDLILDRELSPSQMWETLSVCCRVMGHAERVKAKIRPLIGRLLLQMQNSPESYQKLGYDTFEGFLKAEVVEKLGVSRTDCYAAKKVAVAFPTLSISEQAKIGIVNMSIVSSITSEKNSDHKKILKVAATSSIAQLKQYAVEKKLIEPGDTDRAVITILTSKPVAKQWDAFVRSGKVQSACNSKDHGTILGSLMADFLSALRESSEE